MAPRELRLSWALLLLISIAILGCGSDQFAPRPRSTLRAHAGPIHSIVFAPDGKTFVTGSGDKTATIWDGSTLRMRTVLQGHTDSIWCVAFSPDGKSIATASLDGTARVWDARTGRQRLVFVGHGRPSADGKRLAVYTVAFSPRGGIIASGGADETVRLWEVETGKEKAVLRGHDYGVLSVAFSPDGMRLASRSPNGVVRLWDVGAGTLVKQWKSDGAVSLMVYRVVFSPDGAFIACNGRKSVKIRDSRTGAEQQEFGTDLRRPLCSIAFAVDGKSLAGAGLDGTVRLWEAGSGKLLRAVPGRSVLSLAFSTDGHRLATGSRNGVVDIWDMETLLGSEVEGSGNRGRGERSR